MDSNTKRSLLVTVVGVTLFVALLRFSDVLAFAARLVDLVLPILAGGILALFINVPMTGLEKRLKQLFRKAKKQPPDKTLHLLSFFLTLVGIVLVLVLALTLLVPELVKSFHSLYLQIESNIPRWTAYLSAQDADMGWLMHWLEGINWEQLLHKVTASIDKVLVNAVSAVSATVNVIVTASFALIISVYLSLGTESLGRQAHTLVCAYLKPRHAAGLLRFCRGGEHLQQCAGEILLAEMVEYRLVQLVACAFGAQAHKVRHTQIFQRALQLRGALLSGIGGERKLRRRGHCALAQRAHIM